MPANSEFDAVVFRLSHLGDIVLTTGVLEHWQKTRGMRVAFITREGYAPVLENHPAISRVVALTEDEIKNDWKQTAKRLAGEFAGLPLIDLHGTLRSFILRRQWKGKIRSYPKFSLSRRLYHKYRLKLAEKRLLKYNVPQRYAMALDRTPPSAKALLPHIFPTRKEIREAEALLGQVGAGKPLAALHPYATHPNKSWPRHCWIELTDRLKKNGWNWIVVGRDKDPFLAELAGQRDLTSRTSLRETCAVLAKADVLITGDSGPMHLACAVGTPVVSLFGPTTRVWGFYPEGPGDVVLEQPEECRPCSLHGGDECRFGRKCLAEIDAARVLKHILEVKRF